MRGGRHPAGRPHRRRRGRVRRADAAASLQAGVAGRRSDRGNRSPARAAVRSRRSSTRSCASSSSANPTPHACLIPEFRVDERHAHANRSLEWLASSCTTPRRARGFVVGLSGGIDSAVVARLCQMAAPGGVVGVIMPCHSDPQDEADARLVADHFEIPTIRIDLEPPTIVWSATLRRRDRTLPPEQSPRPAPASDRHQGARAARQREAAAAHDVALLRGQLAELPGRRHRQPQRAGDRLLHEIRRRRRRPAAASATC